MATMVPALEHTERVLVEPFLAAEIAERAYVRQSESEAEQILVAHICDGIAAIFHRDAAAIPVVGGLRGSELQLPCFRIETHAGSSAESGASQPAEAQRHAELVELAGWLRRGSRTASPLRLGERRTDRLRNLQKRIPTPDGKGSQVVVDQQGAGVDTAQLEVVIEIPFCVGIAAGGNPKARHDGRKMPRLRRESNAGQVFSGGKHIALSGHECSAKGRIDKIFLRNLPSGDLAHIRSLEAWQVIELVLASPGNDLLWRCSADR